MKDITSTHATEDSALCFLWTTLFVLGCKRIHATFIQDNEMIFYIKLGDFSVQLWHKTFYWSHYFRYFCEAHDEREDLENKNIISFQWFIVYLVVRWRRAGPICRLLPASTQPICSQLPQPIPTPRTRLICCHKTELKHSYNHKFHRFINDTQFHLLIWTSYILDISNILNVN